MKNKPLYIQLSAVFLALILFIGLVFLTVIPQMLKDIFTDDIYQTIEESQLSVQVPVNRGGGHMMGGHMMGGRGGMGMMHHGDQNIRSAEHLFMTADGKLLEETEIGSDVLTRFYNQAMDQSTSSARYSLEFPDQTMLYVISKGKIDNQEAFQISYMWDTYQKELSTAVFKQISLILVAIMVGAFLIAILFSKWLVKPIQHMQSAVAKIKNKDWAEKLSLERADELGELANSIDDMRIQLKKQNEAEKVFLQQISHDLKTPVMVIRSYAQALSDEIYPAGNLEGTAHVIDTEAKNLEKKIKDLLLITKLDYLAETKPTFEKIEIKSLIVNVIDRLQPYRQEVAIAQDLIEAGLIGNSEQLTVLIENMLDNALKYADTTIKIKGELQGNHYKITCENDGKLLPKEVIDQAFQPFFKGKQGNFGLGLTIMKRIVNLHEGDISIDVATGRTIIIVTLPLEP